MSNVKFVLNKQGVAALLKGAEMQGVLHGYAADARSRLGDGYEIDEFIGHDRARAHVKASSEKAIKENLYRNTVLKAVK